MQEPALILLALAAGHLIGDFLLQTGRDVEGKNAFEWPAFARHAAMHYAGTLAALAGFAGLSPLSGAVQAAVLAIVVTHTAIDVGKSTLSRRLPGYRVLTFFLLDQAIHVAVFLLIGWTMLLDRPPSDLLAIAAPPSSGVAALFVTYAAVVVGGGQLIRVALIPFTRALGDRDASEQLAFAGLYIGWLERFLVLTAILVGSYTSVGLIIAAKSIFRFPDLKDRPFAEYFLIGTLMSVALAVVGAMFFRIVIY
jgi:hypothetical protein